MVPMRDGVDHGHRGVHLTEFRKVSRVGRCLHMYVVGVHIALLLPFEGVWKVGVERMAIRVEYCHYRNRNLLRRGGDLGCYIEADGKEVEDGLIADDIAEL